MKARMCAVIAVLAVAAVAWSQQQPPGGGNDSSSGSQQRPPPPGGGNGPSAGFGMRPMGGPQRGDPMMENFFQPELVMHHQKDIALTADQQTAIRAELKNMAGKFADLQWQQSSEEDSLQAMLKEDHPDEKAVLAQLDKVLAIENDLKRMQLGTLVRIKNILTPEQQTQLTELKKKESRMMQGQQGERRGGPGSFPRGGQNGGPQNGRPQNSGSGAPPPPPGGEDQ